MSNEIEIRKVENEPEKTVKVFSRNTFTWVQIGTTVYTPFGVSHFASEREVENYFSNLSLNEETKIFHVSIILYETFVVLSVESFELRLYSKDFILHIEDKEDPKNIQNFDISNQALLLLKYVVSRAEKISFDL